MDPIKQHLIDIGSRIGVQSSDLDLLSASRSFFDRSHLLKYSYNFSWFDRPIIQYPQDIVAVQEIVSRTKPDCIFETGIAHGGSMIFHASLLCLLDIIDGLDPRSSPRKVLGVDIDIRSHNLNAIKDHPLSFKIDMIQGSSVAPSTISKVHNKLSDFTNIMVCLDSNHTHDHVFEELCAYAPLVQPGGYCVVFDTVIEDMPEGSFPDRPWGKGNNPKTAVESWLAQNINFEIDHNINQKLLISVAPNGYLQRIS